MEEVWERLWEAAREKLMPRRVSPLIEVGGVSAAILTESGSIYTGVCIDASCSLGMCAERNAVANMLTNGESKVMKLLCIDWDGRFLPPCGACRELLLELGDASGEMEVILAPERIVKLRTLLPDWWGVKYMSPGAQAASVQKETSPSAENAEKAFGEA